MLSGLAQRLEAAGAGFVAMRTAVDAGTPWPLSPAFGVEPEASWGPPELLAHVAEMLPFWLGETERVLAGTEEPVPFGRVSSDALRIGVIERDRTLPLTELYARVANGVDRWSARLGQLSSKDAARRGLHATLGEFTVDAMVERFVVNHAEEHVRQLGEILAVRN
jgi:hypothetical protein